ncbi:hypothetical protein HQ544_00630 [Candidatus Falkowbacteria bacterium]|nr:hypothetical protein [Candidatus Falkowbacteria bacterium]
MHRQRGSSYHFCPECDNKVLMGRGADLNNTPNSASKIKKIVGIGSN